MDVSIYSVLINLLSGLIGAVVTFVLEKFYYERPYVIAYIRWGGMVPFVYIKNIGKLTASDVKIKAFLDHDLVLDEKLNNIESAYKKVFFLRKNINVGYSGENVIYQDDFKKYSTLTIKIVHNWLFKKSYKFYTMKEINTSLIDRAVKENEDANGYIDVPVR